MTEAVGDVTTVGFTPGRLNIIIPEVGQPWSLTLEWDDSDGGVMNLTGYAARFAWEDPPPRAVIPPVPSVQLGATSPNMVFSLSAEQMTGVSFRAVGYTVYVTEPSADNELPWLTGIVTIGGSGR